LTRAIDTLTFEQLQRFWAHPVRAFFQQRLQVNFRSEESEIPDAEPFTLEGLERYQLNLQLLNALVEQEDADKLFAAIVRRGSCLMARLGRSSGRRSVRR
jgi:exodeoxyribonuclease V gamma subunit